MFTKIHGLGLGPSITMLLGNTHGPLREDEAEPEQETRKYKPVKIKQDFLAELRISFAHRVDSTLLIRSWCVQSFKHVEFSSKLKTLFPHIPQGWIFTYTHRTFLMLLLGLMFPQTGFLQAPSASSQPGRALGEKLLSQGFRACSPIWDPKMEQHNKQMGGTNRASENLEGTFVSNSAFKRGKRPRAFALFIPTHFPILTWGSNKSGPCRVLQMD